MNGKEQFIKEIAAAGIKFSELAQSFYDEICGSDGLALTDKGKIILQFMANNKNRYNNIFKSQTIAADLNITSRAVSGSMRKLVIDGFVSKMGQNPVCYSLTEKGAEIVDFI